MSNGAFWFIALYAVVFAVGLAFFCGIDAGKSRD